MAKTIKSPPPIKPNERLGMTLFLALFFHGIIILGLTFKSSETENQEVQPLLDVILVQTRSETEPDEADYLAQASQEGGGESENDKRPTDLFSAPTLAEQPGVAPQQSRFSPPERQQIRLQEVLTQDQSTFSVDSDPKQQQPDQKINPDQPTPELDAQIARLAKELDQNMEAYAKRPRRKFLNSRTREHVAAAYMRQWIDRVERIGNLNYPDEARRQQLSGTLILDVSIDAQGNVINIELRRSSGHQVLDDAALRIVKLASPFAPFPETLQREADIIHITRSWEFQSNNQLLSR